MEKPSPRPRTRELFGLSFNIVVASVVVGVAALVFGVFQSLSSYQRDQIYELRREVKEINKDIRQLREEQAVISAQNEAIDDLASELFILRCELQQGIYDSSRKTCLVGRVTLRYQPLRRLPEKR